MKTILTFTVALLSLGALGCKTESTLVPHEPLVHRPSANLGCPTERAAGDCTFGNPDMGGCATDSHCTAGARGRCLPSRFGCSCSYDGCTQDDECGGESLCACRTSAASAEANRCLPSDCRDDGDCGVGGFCSPSFDATCGPYSGIARWHCHTAKDKCIDDRDCTTLDGGGVQPYCAYQPELGYWACSVNFCVG